MPVLPRFVVLLLSVSPLAAQPPEQGPTPRHVDRYGDPLPAGAIQRFGSLRLRHRDMTGMAVLPDGKTVLCVGGGGIARVARWWDLDSGRQMKVTPLPDDGTRGILSADGSVFSGVVDGWFVLVDSGTGRVAHTFPVRAKDVHCVAVSADGARLAVGFENGHVTVCRRGSAKTVTVEISTRKLGYCEMHVSFSPDGKRLVAGTCVAGKLRVLDADTGEEVFARKCESVAAALSPKGDRLAVAEIPPGRPSDHPATIRLLDLRTGMAVPISPEPEPARAAWLEMSPDGRWLAAYTAHYQFSLIDVATGRVVHRLRGRAPCRFTPDSARLVVGLTNRFAVFDVATGRDLGDPDGDCEFEKVKFSQDGRRLVVGSWIGQRLEVWETGTARPTAVLPFPNGCFTDCLFMNSGRTVRACSSSFAWTWDVATSRASHVPHAGVDGINFQHHQLAGQDGRRTAVITAAGKGPYNLSVFDAETGQLTGRSRVGAGSSNTTQGRYALAWLPGGDAVVETNQLEFVIASAGPGVEAVTLPGDLFDVSADGRWLAAARPLHATTVGCPVQFWESATGREVTPSHFEGRSGKWYQVAVHGRKAIVMNDDRGFAVLDIPSATVLGHLAACEENPRPAGNYLLDVRLLPDGRTAFTALADGTALTWDLSRFAVKPLSATHTAADLTQWWADLAGEDARAAYGAIWRLAEAPADVLIPFLRMRLRPVDRPAAAEWRELILGLDHPQFRVRDAATRRLERLDPGFVDELAAEYRHATSPEARERLKRLLDIVPTPICRGETLRFLRALAVLEEVKTPAARRLVEELNRGVATSKETKAAVATLARMPDTESWRR